MKPASTAKSSVMLFGSKFQFFKVTLIASIVALLALFLPFAKSGMLAVIFACAIVGAKDRIHVFSKQKKIVLFSSIGAAFFVLTALVVTLLKTIFIALYSISNPEELSRLKIKISGLFLPTLIALEQQLEKMANLFGRPGSLETKLTESGSHLFDSVFTFALNGISQIPENSLQIFFFLFLMIFLFGKINVIEHAGFSFFSNKNNASMRFLISAAKQSAYNSVGATIATALAQATVLTIGAAIIGIALWPVVFLVSFVFAMVPIVGVLPVTIACTIYASSELDAKRAITIAIFGLGASIIDNFLRPILVTKSHPNLNPVLSFFALVGSLFIFGFSGLFIGPFVLVFVSTLIKKII